MKKILFAFTLMLTLAFGATAQTTVQVNDINAGYIEQYPAITEIIEDTLITYDTVGDVVDTIATIIYDTSYFDGYYVFRAIAYTGYTFDRWEVITTYTKWYDIDSLDNVTELDSIWLDTIIQYDNEYVTDSEFIDYDGWLEWDTGIPDLSEVEIDDISSIVITAYFNQNDLAGIERGDASNFTVHPNPTIDKINVLGDVHQITVYDMSGRVVATTDSHVINMRSWPNGTYLVHMTDIHGNMSITKVIKR